MIMLYTVYEVRLTCYNRIPVMVCAPCRQASAMHEPYGRPRGRAIDQLT